MKLHEVVETGKAFRFKDGGTIVPWMSLFYFADMPNERCYVVFGPKDFERDDWEIVEDFDIDIFQDEFLKSCQLGHDSRPVSVK